MAVSRFNSTKEVIVATLHKGIVSEISGGPWSSSMHTGFTKASQIKMEDGQRIIGPIATSDLLKSVMLEGEAVEFSIYKNLFFIPVIASVKVVKTGEVLKSDDLIARQMMLGYLTFSIVWLAVIFVPFGVVLSLSKSEFLATMAGAAVTALILSPLFLHLRSWRQAQAIVGCYSSGVDVTQGNQEYSGSIPGENKNRKSSDWLISGIAAVSIAGLFGFSQSGLLGGFMTLGVYYWLKPKIGVLGSVALASVIGFVFAWTLLNIFYGY